MLWIRLYSFCFVLPVWAEEGGFRLEGEEEMSYGFQAIVNAQVAGRRKGRGPFKNQVGEIELGRQLRCREFASHP